MLACALPLALSGCTKIEETWQYKSFESRQENVNKRVRAAVLAGLALARAEGRADVPQDADVPQELFGASGTLDPLVAEYGLDESGSLRGEGPHLDMLLSELELAQEALNKEKKKPEYMISGLL